MSFDIDIQARMGDCRPALRLATDATLVAVTGPSGAGKTTLLNCISGLVKPDYGQISIVGRTHFDSDNGIDVPPDKRGCGYVFQDARLFPHLTVEQNLLFGQKYRRGSSHWTLDELTDLLNITALLSRRPASLSGGETKRVAIGRALLSAPDFLLLDEPLVSLDSERAEHVNSLIETLKAAGNIPILLVSHDPAEVARLTETVIRLD